MKRNPCSGRTRAFTLVELLTVIAIIAILAALLLPVLDKSESRGKRVFCINNLSQVGLAFHSFSNDHSGKFPMALSTNDGGSLEYVESGFNSGPMFYTAFYHFQALSNELVFPRILTCPTDLRPAATNFPSLQNENLSYFVGVTATFDKPESILAGDRNLATNSWFQTTILGYGLASSLSWTWELHQHKGDVLFADGHVEQWNDYSFGSGANEGPANLSFFLPSVLPVENSFANASQGSRYGAGSYGNAASGGAPSYPGNLSPSVPARQNASLPNKPQPSISSSADNPNYTSQANPTADVSGNSGSGMSEFNRKLTRTLQHDMAWGYFWLWLLFMLYAAYRTWKWYQRKREVKLRDQTAMPTRGQAYTDNDGSPGA